MQLPIVMRSAGTLCKWLDCATKEMDIPKAKKRTIRIQQAPPIQYTQSTEPYIPTAIPGKTKANRRSKGKNERQIASFPTPICPTAFFFFFFLFFPFVCLFLFLFFTRFSLIFFLPLPAGQNLAQALRTILPPNVSRSVAWHGKRR
jgi:hypothetical protein